MTTFAPSNQLIGSDDIEVAEARLKPYIAPTPLLKMTPTGLAIKAENLHPVGSFKLRGAFNSILQLTKAQRDAGVIAHSSGNHAQAVAYAAARLGVKAVVVMPNNAPKVKRDGATRWGADVILVGPASDERKNHANALAAAHGYTAVEPYDSPDVIAATATIAVEIFAQMPDVSDIYAAVGGGGLLAGIARAAQLLRPDVRVWGCEPELAADALASLRAGAVVSLPGEQMATTSADGVRVQQLGALNWTHIHGNVADVITATEDEIGRAVKQIAYETRLIAEPSGALTIASALRHGPKPKACAILGGGNVDLKVLARLLTDDGKQA